MLNNQIDERFANLRSPFLDIVIFDALKVFEPGVRYKDFHSSETQFLFRLIQVKFVAFFDIH